MYFRPFTAVKLFKSTALVGVGLQLLWILLYTYRFGEKKENLKSREPVET